MTIIISLFAGLVFGLGLLLSGMADPAKVLGFLDLARRWDPSLAFVMGGAIAVGLPAFALARRMQKSWGQPFDLPRNKQVDRRLVLGSLTFGVGWGIAGLCPGPALVALGMGKMKAAVFVLSMLAGMKLFEWLDGRKKVAAKPSAESA